ANHMETTLFLSQPDGTYKVNPLPVQAQYAPVYATTIFDFDDDGADDILLCGNNSHMKLRLGSIDASFGVLLKGDGEGNFQYIDQATSGFKLRGDVRSVVEIEDALFFGINQ